MADATTNPYYAMSYIADMSDAARMNSMDGTGPVKMAGTAWVAMGLSKWAAPVVGTTEVTLSMVTIEYVHLPFMILSDELQKSKCNFTIVPARWAKWHKSCFDAGIDDSPVDKVEDFMTRIADKAITIPYAERVIEVTD